MTFRRKQQSPQETWVLVADGGRARVFSRPDRDAVDLKELTSMECADALAHPHDLVSDRQGYFRGRAGHLDAGDTQTSFRDRASRRFAHEIAEYLEKGRQEGHFGHLIIIAAPHFLGLVRAELSDSLSQLVERTIPKDLTSLSVEDIAARIKSKQPDSSETSAAELKADALFKMELIDEIAILTPVGDLGELVFEHIHPEAQRTVQEFATSRDQRHVVIDLHNTDYFGSSTMGFFTRLWKLVRQRGGSMVFCNLSDRERELLKLTRLDTLWPERATREEAIAAVRQEICATPP